MACAEQRNELDGGPCRGVTAIRALRSDACPKPDQIAAGVNVFGRHADRLGHAERFENSAVDDR